MFSPKKTFKFDAEKQWHLPDRIFFGFGACHILAGTFLMQPPLKGFHAEWIDPDEGFSGTHFYVTDGIWAFDFQGYCLREELVARYWRGQEMRQADWNANIRSVNFSLLDTAALNKIKHRGPDQYFSDPIPRAIRFISDKKLPSTLC